MLTVCLALAYSIISPIINGLAVMTFFLYYLLWKYLFLWQLDGQASGETGGLFFPKALQHVFVGLYIQQICLAALFFLARDQNKNASAVPEGALMIVLIIFTAFFHLIINNSYGPLIKYLPLTLADMTNGKTDENVAAAAEELEEDASDEGHSNDCEKRAVRKRASTASAKEFPTKVDAEAIEDVAEPEASGSPLAQKASLPVPKEERSRKGSCVSSVPGVDEEVGPKDFYHPASVEPQRYIIVNALA